MDKRLSKTTNTCVQIMNSKRKVKGKLGHVSTNSRLRLDVNVMLNLPIVAQDITEH